MAQIADIILTPMHVDMEYHTDPLVMVSLFHHQMEPHTLCMDDITTRFTAGDVSSMVWGPAAWELLHTLARSPYHTKVHQLLQCWTNILPCAECRKHLTQHLVMSPFVGSTAQETYHYTVSLHNAVNKHLKKPVHTPNSSF